MPFDQIKMINDCKLKASGSNNNEKNMEFRQFNSLFKPR